MECLTGKCSSLMKLLGTLLLALLASLAEGEQIGVCYGKDASRLPSDQQVVSLLKSHNIGKIRMYDSGRSTVQAFKGTGIEITLGVLNTELGLMASKPAAARGWVNDNVAPFYPQANIKYVAVGNEVFRNGGVKNLLPAMRNLQNALNDAKLSNIKVSTPHAADVLGKSSPPSDGEFRGDISGTMRSILQFLRDNQSPFMVHIYPYFSYKDNKQSIHLNYALFQPGDKVGDINGRTYNNLFDAIYDSVVAAMGRLGFPNIPIIVTESGWPSSGGDSASVENARTYNNNLIRHVLSTSGTPARSGKPLPTYIFDLFNEDGKGPPEFEKHFGLFNIDTSPSYLVNFSPK